MKSVIYFNSFFLHFIALLFQPSSSANNEIQDAIEATAESIDQVSNQQNENEVTSETTETNSEVTTETSNTTSNATVVETESTPSDTSTLATIKIRFINEDSLEIREKLTEKLGLFISKHLDRWELIMIFENNNLR